MIYLPIYVLVDFYGKCRQIMAKIPVPWIRHGKGRTGGFDSIHTKCVCVCVYI